MIHLLWECDKVSISHRLVWIRSRTFAACLDEAGNSHSWALPNCQPWHGEEVLGGVREGISACHSAFLEQCPRWWCHKSYNLLSCREWILLSEVIRNDQNQWSEVLGNKAEACITKCPWLSQILVLSVISHQKPWWVRAVTDSKRCAASGAYHTLVKVTGGVDLWFCLRMIVPGPCILIMEPAEKSDQEEEVPSGSEWSSLGMDCRQVDWSSWHSLRKTCQFGHALACSCPLNSLQWMVMDLYSRDNIVLERNSPSASSPEGTLGGPGKGRRLE